MQSDIDFYNYKVYSYKSLVRFYGRKYSLCEKLGKYYIPDFNIFRDIKCMKWVCRDCRQIKKMMMFVNVLKNVYSFDMKYHYVITFSGKNIRDRISWIDSFRYMADVWIRYSRCLMYHFGKFDYILFPRSQSSGYCHYHIILNKNLDWYILDKKRRKYGLGYVSIMENEDVADYLSLDFWKDREYVIPFGNRHFRTNRNVILNNEKNDLDVDYFNFEYGIDDIADVVREKYCKVLDVDDYVFDKYVKLLKKKENYLKT